MSTPFVVSTLCVCVCELNHLLFFHRISSRCISLFLATISCVDSNNSFFFLRYKKKYDSFCLFYIFDGSTLLLSMATSPGYSSSYQAFLTYIKKKREKKKQQKITYTHDVQSKHTRNEHLRKVQAKNQTTLVVFVCDGHSELSLPPISNCLSILQNIFFYCARVSKLLLTHSRC